ncbi:MAG: hypothetical protein AAFU79_21665 [Myxococcota bacterium]
MSLSTTIAAAMLVAAAGAPWLQDDGRRYGPLQRRMLSVIAPRLDPDGAEELEGEPLSVFSVDLDGDGSRDYVAQLTNDDAFCTHEGCLTFVLRGQKRGFEVVGQFYAWKVRLGDRPRGSKYRELWVRGAGDQVRRYIWRARKYQRALSRTR